MKKFALVNGNQVLNIVVAEEKPEDIMIGSFIEYDESTNEAKIGGIYNFDKNKFIGPQPYPSWILNETTCLWEAPVAKPENAGPWNELTQSWITPE